MLHYSFQPYIKHYNFFELSVSDEVHSSHSPQHALAQNTQSFYMYMYM